MEKIINYFLEEIQNYTVKKTHLENELNSKKIVSAQIAKKIDEMVAAENDTDNIFRASMSNLEFHNNEILLLKQQLDDNNHKIVHYENSLNILLEKIDKIYELLEEARNVNIEIPEFPAEEAAALSENSPEKESPENLVDTLRNISSRMELAVKLGRIDKERAKMELNLARVKLMFCIEDLEKQ